MVNKRGLWKPTTLADNAGAYRRSAAHYVYLSVTLSRALKIIVAPATKPLIRIAAAFGLVLCLCVILLGFNAEPIRVADRHRHLLGISKSQRFEKRSSNTKRIVGSTPAPTMG